MIAYSLIDDTIKSVHIQDTVADVLSVMADCMMESLPVIDNEKKYIGNIQEGDLLDIADTDKSIEQYVIEETGVSRDEHFLNILKKPSLLNYQFIAIVDREGLFLGSISIKTIINFLAQTRSIEEQGGVIVLELKSINYSLAEISKIVESNNASIIHSFITNSPQSENIYVTIKINKTDLKEIVLSFERFNYQVHDVFHSSEYEKDLQERYDSLMVYLNV
ncbi:MAG: hypothetical protein M9958_06165 [Chitinophagales bacterium]|nr:hypothetical protein [Chitinophagales bacterium]